MSKQLFFNFLYPGWRQKGKLMLELVYEYIIQFMNESNDMVFK